MARYVLRYTGTGPVPDADLDRVRARTRVVDQAGPTLLVDGTRARVEALTQAMPLWVCAPETVVALAPTRPQVRAASRPRRASA